jgi:predicted NAD/FAD-dependent oxidoreductase
MTAMARHAHNTYERAVNILEQTYPAWNIRRASTGMWSARRSASSTQATAGLHRYIIQPTMEALAAVLAQQLEIAQRVRG